jgi:hypothetical protein
MFTLIFKIKTLTLLQMHVPSLLCQLLFIFLLTQMEIPTMVDDATTFSNLSLAQIQDEEFEKTSFDVNVSQQPCEE